MDFANFLIQLLNSVQYGLLLFMLAAGLTLIFGIMGVVNLAHGSFYMLGAYLAWSLSSLISAASRWPSWAAPCLAVVFGLALERLLFRHFYHRDHLDQVLLTFGLIYIFEEMRSILWGDDVHGVKIPDLAQPRRMPLTDNLSYPVYRLFMSGVCIALALGLYLLISKTRLGMKIRAGAFQPRHGRGPGRQHQAHPRHRVRARRGVGRGRRHDRGAHFQRPTPTWARRC
jgi:branched-chain amino acid transport system permease protein